MVFLLLLFAQIAEAQTIHKFTEGLVTGSSHKYGREAIVYDPLAYQLFTDKKTWPISSRILNISPRFLCNFAWCNH